MDEWFDEIAKRIVRENLDDLSKERQVKITEIIEEELYNAYSRGAYAND